MANALYDKGRESFLKGEISWNADDIKAVLVDIGAYTLDIVNHQFLSDIPGGARVATSPNLSAKTTTAGVADCDDIVVSLVSGATVEAVVFYKDTGVAGTSRLIGYVDTGLGLPFTPNGANITLAIDNGVNKLFKL